MKRFSSIKKNEDFKKVYREGKSYANKNLVMYVIKDDEVESRIGISVSKKVGNSIVRHRVTRVIRECFRLNRNAILDNVQIVVVAREAARNLGYYEMNKSYLHLCRLHRILKEMV